MATAHSDAAGTKAGAAKAGTADNTIEALLERRAQYEQWLARLDSTAEKAPAAVRERVRTDYEARLHGVIDELRGHEATIRQELEQHRATQSRLSAERRSAEETLAEAELRHAVGEYAEEEWQRLSGESHRHLDRLRGELDTVSREIARLAEVQSVISGPGGRAVEAPPKPAVPMEAPEPVSPSLFSAPTPVAVEPTPVEERAPVEPMRAEPQAVEPDPAPEPAPVAASPLDELAFLKSVSDEDPRPAPAPRRPSGPAAVAPKPVETAPVTPAPVASTPAAAPMPAATSTATGASGKTAGMAKTLKCNECGTLNRPTEWYCERCGAELAAL